VAEAPIAPENAGVVEPLVPTTTPAPNSTEDETFEEDTPETTTPEPNETSTSGARRNPTGMTAWEEAAAIYEGVKHKRPMGLSLEKVLDGTRGWAGVTTVGHDLIFAPASSDQILVVNVTAPDNPRLMSVSVDDMLASSMPTAGAVAKPRGPMKWCAAAAIGPVVYMAPLLADAVLVFDVSAWSKSGQDPLANSSYLWDVPLEPHLAKGGTKYAPMFGTEKWLGGSVVGNREYVMGPSYTGLVPALKNLDKPPNMTKVGYWDATGLAGQSSMAKLPLGGEQLWEGSVSYGTKVYFAPYNAESVLVVDTKEYTPEEKTTMDERNWKSGFEADVHAYQILTKALPGGTKAKRAKWHGGALATDKIYFAPHDADTILVVNCLTDKVRQIDVPHFSSRTGKWRGAALLEGKVYFAPYNADGILVLDVATEQTYIVGTRLLSNRTAKWMGAAAIDKRVYFSPFKARKVLVYDTQGVAPGAALVETEAFPGGELRAWGDEEPAEELDDEGDVPAGGVHVSVGASGAIGHQFRGTG
jgi:hypothetical protein